MDGERARVEVEDVARLKSSKRLTLLFDGWEDKLRRSLYGTVASQINDAPVVVSLDELTGSRGTADQYLETMLGAMKVMELEDGENIIALTTDNPTVMQAFRRKFGLKYPRALVCLRLSSAYLPDVPAV
jgi:hypothetical protein